MRLNQQQRLLGKELRKLLPANQDDVAAVAAIAARGYPAVEPILLDLMKWTRHDHWPVGGQCVSSWLPLSAMKRDDVLAVGRR